MDSVGAIIAVLVIAVGLLASVGVAQYTLANGGDEVTFTETFDPGTNQTHVTLNESNRDGVYYSSTVDVTDENGTLMRPGTDYNWHSSNGTLTVLDGGELDGDTEGTVEYSLRVPSEQQQNYASMIGQLVNASYALPLVLGIALMLAGVAALSSLS